MRIIKGTIIGQFSLMLVTTIFSLISSTYYNLYMGAEVGSELENYYWVMYDNFDMFRAIGLLFMYITIIMLFIEALVLLKRKDIR